MIAPLAKLVFPNLLGNAYRGVRHLPRLFRTKPSWVELALMDPLPARPPARGRFWMRGGGPSIASLSKLVDELAKDSEIEGVVLRIGAVGGGWAHLQTLRGIILRLPLAGKRVVAHLSSPTLREYYVASAATHILVDESGPLSLTGLAAEASFYRSVFEKAGALPEAEYRGEYKSFAETFTRSDMSPAHREATDAILDGIEAEVVSAVAASRKLDVSPTRDLLRGGPYLADVAHAAKLVDGVCYWDEVATWLVREKLAPKLAGNDEPKLATLAEWRGATYKPFHWYALGAGRRRVQVISLHGSIVSGEGSNFPRRALGGDAAVRALDAARKDKGVGAVVLHVDSRGGAANASDLMWRATKRLAAEKPVIAYFDDVAASGGYYLACSASKIVAQPLTITGSIGVVAGKVSFESLRSRLGFGAEILTRGEAGAMNTTLRGYSDEERRRLAAEVDALYKQFVAKVSAGRTMSEEATERAARGRVWIGKDANSSGLVDELGDVDQAIALAKKMAARSPREKFDVEDAHVSPRHQGMVARLLGDQAWSGIKLPRIVDEVWELAQLADERALLFWRGFDV